MFIPRTQAVRAARPARADRRLALVELASVVRARRLDAANTALATPGLWMHPAKRIYNLLLATRRRAKKHGVLFDDALLVALTRDPPVDCPCCSAPLDYRWGRGYKNSARSPSIDRTRPGGPYDVTNVRVLCWRCNRLKSDATLAELVAIAAYVRASVG